QHRVIPTTSLLIESAPAPDRTTGGGGSAGFGMAAGKDGGTGKDRGNGEPPSLISPPAGCRFNPRCPHVMPRCTVDLPPRLAIADRPGHWAACWLYDPATVAPLAGTGNAR